ncbi:MAG TPA: plastocyanin/azurin family copper-binding protein [Candidatus Dormibacteraeota bacterium]|nr:plastocyanin/azurin family copper-binding protein [Candidatus Dormibacteraeota bacterium]
MPTPAPTAGSPIQPLLDIAAIFITPDWTKLIALFPIFLALIFALWILVTMRGFAALGPRRRAPARIQPVTPAGVHMPGGSSAPILVAFGAGTLFLGLVVGGIGLWVGVLVLVLTLLVWFREAVRDYDHVAGAQRLPAVVHEGPPPGVHMPGPSIRPLMGALGSAALLGGLVVGGWVLVLAVVFLVYTLMGWLVDFTAEYRKVEEADQTGHLENIPARRLPVRSLQVFAVLFALVALNQAGILPPTGSATAGGPGASPGASGAPGGSAAPGGPGAPAGSLPLTAKGFAYDTQTLEVASGKPFSIFFTNQDPAGTPHDVELRNKDGSVIKAQPPTNGGTSQAYQYDALQPGDYVYICSIHPIPAMTGTLTVK